MGQATLHMAPWSLEDAGREISQAEREKLQGLCYRVRKGLGRHENDLMDADQLRPGQQHAVLFHKEGVPESLDALRVEAGRFKLDLTAGRTNRVCVSLTVPDVNLRSNRQHRFRPHPMRGMRVPRAVDAEFWFEVDRDFYTLWPKFGPNSVPLSLYMAARKCRPCNGSGSWEVPCYAAYAVSDRFLHGVHAEAECNSCAETEPKRWWDSKEHSRQDAREPLNEHAVNPTGIYAQHIEDGGTVLDLDRCSWLPCPPLMCPWKASGVTFSSALALWAFLGNGGDAATGALQQVRCCPELGQAISLFLLEPNAYEFEADVFFGLALTCM